MTTNDPNAAREWHKKAIGLDLLGDEYRGTGVAIGIYDDGIEKTHAELANAYDSSKEFWGYNPQQARGWQSHGTAVAGIIAAQANNGIGGSGIANGAKITSVDVLDQIVDDYSFMAAVRYAATFDVMTNSWGWVNPYVLGPDSYWGQAFTDALESVAKNGRGGLGTIITVAAGNSGAQGWDANNSEFTAARHTITVGATTDGGYRAYYSNPGANLLVSAPSNGGRAGIYTTDESGAAGYSSGNDTGDFGGTSAATPIVASVAALMLQANSNLGWRDVQTIMAITADYTSGSFKETGGAKTLNQTDLWAINGANNVNGGGMAFSNDTGFGQIDAYEAVRFAEVWSLFGNPPKTSSNEKTLSYSSSATKAIAEGGNFTDYQFNVATGISIESVAINLVMTHADVDQLRIELVSPDGTVSQLLRSGIIDSNKNSFQNKAWSFSSNEFWGELSAGTWTIRVYDTVAGTTGSISSASLSIYGADTSINNVYHYTDDFLRMVAIEPSRSVITDTNGGVDWLNFAAIRGGVDADLTARSIVMRGVSTLTIAAGTDIENVVSGDGNDVLRGNGLANYLAGMRGDDILDGRAGADTLDGGQGKDTASYSFSSAAVDVDLRRTTQIGGDAAGDHLIAIENVFGSAFNDSLVGDAGNNELTGGLGDDYLDGGTGSDTATFDGDRSDYKVGLNQDGTISVWDTRSGGTGLDRLVSIEALRFSDQTYSVVGFVFDPADQVPAVDPGSPGTPNQPPPSTIPTIVGTVNADTINGTSGNDVIAAGSGDDRISASGGYDIIDSGNGSDTYVLSGQAAAYTFSHATNEQGDDVLQVRSATNSADLTNVEFIQVGGAVIAISDIRTRVVMGSAGNDTFNTQASDEAILAGAGNDTINASLGPDVYDGGLGLDTVNYAASDAGVTVNLGQAAQTGGFAEGDTLVSIENVRGSAFDDTLTGTAGANVIQAGAGNDTLRDGLGNDTVTGEAGNDTFIWGGGIDVFDGGLGSDTVDLSAMAQGATVNMAGRLIVSGSNRLTASNVEGIVGTDYADSFTGSALADTILAGADNDTITGGLGNDVLDGGDGSDTAIYSGRRSDYVFTANLDGSLTVQDTRRGGEGTDTLTNIETIRFADGTYLASATATAAGYVVTQNDDPLFVQIGTAANETFTGSAVADYISAGAGNDIINGTAGADVIDGGLGLDTVNYAASDAGVTVDLGQAAQTGGFAEGDTLVSIESVRGSGFDDTLTGTAGANVIQAGAGNDTLRDGLGNDILYGEVGDDTFIWGGGIDGFDGGLGLDTIDLSGLGQGASVNIAGRLIVSGTNRLTIGNVERIVGTDYADTVLGSVGGDTILAGAGNDTITGGLGNDILDGGDGADTAIYSGRRSDYVFTANLDGSLTVQDTRRGGEGTDTLTNIETIRFADGTYLASATATAAGYVVTQNDDPLFVQIGTAANETFTGSAVADYISAGAGNDIINGTAGADVIDGGLGLDTVNYAASDAGVTVNLGQAAQTGGFAEGDTLVSIENVRGSAFDDTLTGTAGANVIQAGAGNDTLRDGLGNDTVTGEAGNDTFIWGGGIDGFDGGLGLDTIDLSGLGQGASVNMAGRLIVSGTNRLAASNVEGIVGTDYADSFTGSALADTILAGADNDTITGDLGNDVLDGGDGSDTAIYSGRRSDYVFTTNLDGSLTVQDTRRGGEGTDTLTNIETIRFADGTYLASATATAAGYVVTQNDDPLFVQIGTAANETFTGSAVADYISAGAGNDIINGTAGADVIDGGLGLDTVNYAASDAGVTVNLGQAAQTGGFAEGDTLVSIENVRGSALDDTLTGTAGANVISAGAGNDTLRDGLGNDTVTGEAGNDTFIWGGGIDVFDGGLGSDTVDLSAMAQGATVNMAGRLIVSGSNRLTASNVEGIVGTDYADSFTGSALADTILAGAGNDTITGGLGNDVLDGGDGSDTAIYSGRRSDYVFTANLDGSLTVQDTRRGGEGTDTLTNIETTRFADGTYLASATATAAGYVVTQNDDPLFVQIGTAANETFTGSAVADYISAGAGNDIVNGTAGADVIDGGLGIDTVNYAASDAGVTVDLAAGTASGGFAQGDTLVSIEILRSSSYDDVLTDALGTQGLYAGSGNDTLLWHGGVRDVLDGGAGIDTLDLRFVFSATVNLATGAAVSGTNTASVLGMENVIGTDGNDTIIGNTLANRIEGGLGNDTLTGGGGADTFVFSAGDGSDVIADFLRGQDKMEIHGLTFADLTFDQAGSNTVVRYGSSDITLVGVRSVTPSDFVFS